MSYLTWSFTSITGVVHFIGHFIGTELFDFYFVSTTWLTRCSNLPVIERPRNDINLEPLSSDLTLLIAEFRLENLVWQIILMVVHLFR